MRFSVVRKGWGEDRVVEVLPTREEADKACQQWNDNAARDFREGRIMYDVPEYHVV